jgi:hypothetical protein
VTGSSVSPSCSCWNTLRITPVTPRCAPSAQLRAEVPNPTTRGDTPDLARPDPFTKRRSATCLDAWTRPYGGRLNRPPESGRRTSKWRWSSNATIADVSSVITRVPSGATVVRRRATTPLGATTRCRAPLSTHPLPSDRARPGALLRIDVAGERLSDHLGLGPALTSADVAEAAMQVRRGLREHREGHDAQPLGHGCELC